jgi:hypothetical protein
MYYWLLYLVKTKRQLEVIKKLNFILNLGNFSLTLHSTNKTIVTLSSCLCQSIVNLVECLREIDEREAKHEEC